MNLFFNAYTVRALFINIPELRREILRKSIHMIIAITPTLAAINMGITVALLGAGVIIYTYSEVLRAKGYSLLNISGIKDFALREKEGNSFAGGPVTLALGAMAALL